MTQQQKILQALKQAGTRGINSYTAREELQIIQLPTRVWELKRLGHNIIEKTNKDKSVNYILLDSPIVSKPHRPIEDEYVFIGNRAVLKEKLEPKQMEAFI